MKVPEPIIEPFDAALERFRQFDAGQGLPAQVVWVFREDVTSRRRRIAVRWPVAPDNEAVARKRYGVAVRRGLGLRLEVLCLLGGVSCCTIWVPNDDLDASYAMLSGLKLSVPTNPITARPARKGLTWWLLCWFDRRSRSGWIADQVQPRS